MVILCWLFGVSLPSETSGGCKARDEGYLHQLWSQSHVHQHWTLTQVPTQGLDVLGPNITRVDCKETCLPHTDCPACYIVCSKESTKCPAEGHSVHNVMERLGDRSYCPWYYLYTEDWNRYPVYLAEAAKKCEDSVMFKGRAIECLYCEPLQYNVTILQKTNVADEDGFCVYEHSYQTIAVGFTLSVAPGCPYSRLKHQIDNNDGEEEEV